MSESESESGHEDADYEYSMSDADPMEELDDDMDEEELVSGRVDDKVPCDDAVEDFFDDEDITVIPKVKMHAKISTKPPTKPPTKAPSKAHADHKPPTKAKPQSRPKPRPKPESEPDVEPESEDEPESEPEIEPKVAHKSSSKSSSKSNPKSSSKSSSKRNSKSGPKSADKASLAKEGVQKSRSRPSKSSGRQKMVGKAESGRFLKYVQSLGRQKTSKLRVGETMTFSTIKALSSPEQRDNLMTEIQLAFATVVHYGDFEQLRKAFEDPFPGLKVNYTWDPAPRYIKDNAPNFAPAFRIIYDVLSKPFGLDIEPEPMAEDDEM